MRHDYDSDDFGVMADEKIGELRLELSAALYEIGQLRRMLTDVMETCQLSPMLPSMAARIRAKLSA